MSQGRDHSGQIRLLFLLKQFVCAYWSIVCKRIVSMLNDTIVVIYPTVKCPLAFWTEVSDEYFLVAISQLARGDFGPSIVVIFGKKSNWITSRSVSSNDFRDVESCHHVPQG
ncbi:hypothetical protein [Rhizobium sp. AP16]|uniref:hypothetical protein n=1 Tax=Rhizobium sp. AP16 TaxID=1144306 RepID=UPI00026ED259|nr:hypothetical protein [Rhizobium sp. AP16]EJK83550.1 hypothetical protein PMI03_03205 [Rhizobium sp. AP16]